MTKKTLDQVETELQERWCKKLGIERFGDLPRKRITVGDMKQLDLDTWYYFRFFGVNGGNFAFRLRDIADGGEVCGCSRVSFIGDLLEWTEVERNFEWKAYDDDDVTMEWASGSEDVWGFNLGEELGYCEIVDLDCCRSVCEKDGKLWCYDDDGTAHEVVRCGENEVSAEGYDLSDSFRFVK